MTPTQLIPAPQTTATPQPSFGAGAQDGEGVVADGDVRGEAARVRRLLHLVDLGGEVDARQQQLPDVGDRAGAVLDPCLGRAPRASRSSITCRAPSRPRWCGELSAAADEREHFAVGAHEGEVGLRVAAVDRQDERRAHATLLREELRQVLAVGGEQLLGQLLDRRHLPDERVREQRLVDELAVARDRGRSGQPLVGGDVLHEPEQLGRERRLLERLRASGGDARRDLDRVVVGEAGERAVVADVDDLGVAGVAREGGDELRGGLAVEGAAAALEQLRLGRQRRVAVELEQLALDLGDLGRARLADELRGEHLVVEVEVAEVVRRDHAEPLEQRAGQVDAARRARRRARPAGRAGRRRRRAEARAPRSGG